MHNIQTTAIESDFLFALKEMPIDFAGPPTAGETALFRAEALEGLRCEPRTLPCKYLYDEAGSRLFDRICDLPEYYPTRAEEAILTRHGGEIADVLGRDFALIEYGSGSSRKTGLLLERIKAAAYVPIDISRRHLERSARRIAENFPGLQVHPVCGDYSCPISIPPQVTGRRVVYFSGSTIGNFHPAEAAEFIRGMSRTCGADGSILIGVDLRKDPKVLWRAYNDSAGVTAEFNLNLLRRMNRQLDARFDIPQFAHSAPYNPQAGRVEMHLVSRIDQIACVGDVAIPFSAGQSIRTECSYKYTLKGFAELAAAAGLSVAHVWTDPQNWFSLQHLRRA
jgi:dimethylhistidine N-methyltransferase